MQRTELALALVCSVFVAALSAFAQTWQPTGAPTAWWTSVACSADGSKLAAAAGSYSGYPIGVYVSTNSGATWTACTNTESWLHVGCSADGSTLVAANSFPDGTSFITALHTSTNWGATWAPGHPAFRGYTGTIASSADGRVLIVGAVFRQVVISTNWGTGWSQVSLDGGNPADHDHYRGQGSWEKTVDGIKLLQERGIRVRLSTTETPINSSRLEQICTFHRSLGIPDEDHFVRPLARRGYSKEGLELGMSNLIPEVTVNIQGVFWHPLSTEADMQISTSLFPLSASVDRIHEQLEINARSGTVPLPAFT